LGNLLDLGSELLVQPGSKPQTIGRQHWWSCYQLAMGWESLHSTLKRWGNRPPCPHSLRSVPELLSRSTSDPPVSHDCVLPRHCGRMSLSSLTCDYFFFSGPQGSSVSNNSPSQDGTSCSSRRCREQHNGFLLQFWPAAHIKSLHWI
jgi:hypothetical protein